MESLNAVKNWMEREIQKPSILGSTDREGFVIRSAAAIKANQFGKFIAKFVRKGHIQTDQNWAKKWQKAKLVEMENALEHYPQSVHSEDPSKLQNRNKSKKTKKVKASMKTSLIICGIHLSPFQFPSSY